MALGQEFKAEKVGICPGRQEISRRILFRQGNSAAIKRQKFVGNWRRVKSSHDQIIDDRGEAVKRLRSCQAL